MVQTSRPNAAILIGDLMRRSSPPPGWSLHLFRQQPLLKVEPEETDEANDDEEEKTGERRERKRASEDDVGGKRNVDRSRRVEGKERASARMELEDDEFPSAAEGGAEESLSDRGRKKIGRSPKPEDGVSSSQDGVALVHSRFDAGLWTLTWDRILILRIADSTTPTSGADDGVLMRVEERIRDVSPTIAFNESSKVTPFMTTTTTTKLFRRTEDIFDLLLTPRSPEPSPSSEPASFRRRAPSIPLPELPPSYGATTLLPSSSTSDDDFALKRQQIIAPTTEKKEREGTSRDFVQGQESSLETPQTAMEDPCSQASEENESRPPEVPDDWEPPSTAESKTLLTCQKCRKAFKDKKALHRHSKRHLPPSQRPWQCQRCDKTFVEKTNLVVHLRSHDGVKLFRCAILGCGKSFSSRHSLREHDLGSHPPPFAAPTHADNDGVNDGEATPATDDVKPLLSPLRFRCQVCGKKFVNAKRLKRHVLTVHAVEKRFRCEICQKAFADKYSLQPHMKIHYGDKQFRCGQCDKSFVQKVQLENHKRSHTGEKPFLCDICSKSFSSSSQLADHTRRHSGERPYPCPQCAKTFSLKADLYSHSRLHVASRPYRCADCDKTYVKSSALRQHRLAVHADVAELPFRCDDCGKGFARKNDLTRHSALHTGEKPFKCDKCEKGFLRRIFLKRHLQKCGQNDQVSEAETRSTDNRGLATTAVSASQGADECDASQPSAMSAGVLPSEEDRATLTMPLTMSTHASEAFATLTMPLSLTTHSTPSTSNGSFSIPTTMIRSAMPPSTSPSTVKNLSRACTNESAITLLRDDATIQEYASTDSRLSRHPPTSLSSSSSISPRHQPNRGSSILVAQQSVSSHARATHSASSPPHPLPPPPSQLSPHFPPTVLLTSGSTIYRLAPGCSLSIETEDANDAASTTTTTTATATLGLDENGVLTLADIAVRKDDDSDEDAAANQPVTRPTSSTGTSSASITANRTIYIPFL